MARLIAGLLGGALLASVTFGLGAAESEFCLADDQAGGPCPLGVEPAADSAIPDAQPTPEVTRTLGPPTVVQPFAGVATAAAQTDEVTPPQILPADRQKLPPGPPSRFP